MAQVQEKVFESDLIELKDRLMKIKHDAERRGDMTKHQHKKAASLKWKGRKDIEDMCKMFMTFMTTPSFRTAEQLEGEAKERARRIEEIR